MRVSEQTADMKLELSQDEKLYIVKITLQLKEIINTPLVINDALFLNGIKRGMKEISELLEDSKTFVI